MRGAGSSRRTTHPRKLRSRRSARRRLGLARAAIVVLVAALLPGLLSLSSSLAPRAKAAPATCGAGGCTVTVDARDLPSGNPLANFNFVVNADNSRYIDPATRKPVDPFPEYVTTESNSPIVREGDQGHATVNLPDGRYLISVRSLDHKLWGKHITLPADAADNGSLTARIDLTARATPTRCRWARSGCSSSRTTPGPTAPPTPRKRASRASRSGWRSRPTARSRSTTTTTRCAAGSASPPTDGLRQRRTTSGRRPTSSTCTRRTGPCNATRTASGTRPPRSTAGSSCRPGSRRAATAPGRLASSCGSRRPTAPPTGSASSAPRQPFATSGTGEITGTARNWQGWPPFDVLTLGEPVANPFVALSDSTTDRTVYVGQGDANGNFDIQNVPAGTYNMAIWDEQLSYIIRFKPVTVAAGQTVDANDTDRQTARSASGCRAGSAGWTATSTRTSTATRSGTQASRASPTPTWTSAGGTARSRKPPSPTPPGTTSTRRPRVARSASGSSTSRASPALGVTGASVHDEHTG